MKPRNPMGIHVHKRKAGAHKKPFKSVRRKENQSLRVASVSGLAHRTFNPSGWVQIPGGLPY